MKEYLENKFKNKFVITVADIKAELQIEHLCGVEHENAFSVRHGIEIILDYLKKDDVS